MGNILDMWRKESRASGIHPLDRNEVLKRIPSSNQVEDVNLQVLNNSVLQVIEENCSVGRQTKSSNRKCGRKINPGERIVDLEKEPCGSQSNKKKKNLHPRQKQLIMSTNLKIKKSNGDVMIVKKHGMKMEIIDGLCVIYTVWNSIYNVQESATISNNIGILI